MTEITLRVLDGADRGRIFERLPTPVTIGREEGNTIQLNDDRVSRYHLKIQEDNDQLVLTDLDSTNGTRINGETVQLRILRFGDLITLGRSVLLYGSRDQIAQRLADLRQRRQDGTQIAPQVPPELSSLDFEINWDQDGDLQALLHALEPPELPERLSPAQAAQLAELLEYIHIRLRNLLDTVKTRESTESVELEQTQWQGLLDLQARLAEYLRQVGDPESRS